MQCSAGPWHGSIRTLTCVMLLVVFAASLGCITQTGYSGTASEQIGSVRQEDIDGDGHIDYIIYDFLPVTNSEAGRTTQRQIAVAIEHRATYTSFRDFTNVELLDADADLQGFSDSRGSAEEACSQNLGILQLTCIDVGTCARLCSSASVRCKNMVETYGEVIGGSMTAYIRDFREMDRNVYEARKDVLTLKESDAYGRDAYLNHVISAVNDIAMVDTNPVYSRPEVQLCTKHDFATDDLISAAKTVGDYRIDNESYSYTVTLTVKDTGLGAGTLGKDLEGTAVQDTVPAGAIGSGDELSTLNDVITTDSNGVLIDWVPKEPAGEYMLMYGFSSNTPPEDVVYGYRVPRLSIRKVDLTAAEPANTLFAMLLVMTGSYYLAMGITLSLIIVTALVIYNTAMLAVSILRAKAASESAIVGVRKALGRTEISWKMDIVLAFAFLVAGSYSALALSAQPPQADSILDLDSFGFMMTDWPGLGAAVAVFVGVMLAFMAVENLTKILLLERAYGVAIREEKELFLTRADLLQARLKELAGLVEKATEEEFEVGEEYEVLTSIKADRVGDASKKMTPRSKKLVEDDLIKVEGAVERLKERKLTAEDHWQKWSEMIDKMLDEQGEVHAASLLTIPSSLRQWAIRRFAKLGKESGIVIEGEVLKKKKVAPEKMLDSFFEEGMLNGLVVLKDDKVVLARMASGSATVPSMLSVKLKHYLLTLAKNTGQHEPVSYAAIGGKQVLVLMRDKNVDSVLFVGKEKFNDTISAWKERGRKLVSA